MASSVLLLSTLYITSRSQRVTVTPNPTSADKDDTYTYTTTLEFFNDGLNYDEKTGQDK